MNDFRILEIQDSNFQRSYGATALPRAAIRIFQCIEYQLPCFIVYSVLIFSFKTYKIFCYKIIKSFDKYLPMVKEQYKRMQNWCEFCNSGGQLPK